MADYEKVKAQIHNLIANANEVMDSNKSNLTDCISGLIEGYGQGSGSGSGSGGNIEYENIIVKAPECKAMNVRSVENDCVVGNDCIIDGSSGWVYRAFLQYDFSNIPSDAEVLCASLNAFVYYGRDNYKDSECYVGRVTVDWTESTTYNWKNQPAHESYSSTSLDTPMFSPSDVGQWVSVDITSLVKQWINGTSANYGLVVRGIPENTYRTSWNIYTRRYSEGEYATYINVECKVPKNKEEEKEEILLQEKTVTENGEVVSDEGYDGLSKVIVDVKGEDGSVVLNGVNASYQVAKGHAINAGDFVSIINQGNTDGLKYSTKTVLEVTTNSFIDFVKLSDDKVFIIYKNNDNELYGVVVLVNEDDFSTQTPMKIADLHSTTYYMYCRLSLIDENKVAVSYYGTVDGTNGTYVVVCGINNDYTLNIGTPFYVCNGSEVGIYYENNKILVTYPSSSSYLNGMLLKIDDFTLTKITTTTLNNGSYSCYKAHILKLENEKFLIVHKIGNSGLMQGTVCTINDNGITVLFSGSLNSTREVMGASNSQAVAICLLNKNKFIATYKRTGSQYNLKGQVFEITDSGFTKGEEYVLNTKNYTGSDGLSIIPIDESQVIAIHRDNVDNSGLAYTICNINGTEITYDKNVTFNSNSAIANITRSLKLNDTTGLVLHISDSTNRYLALTKFTYDSFEKIIKYNGGVVAGVAIEDGAENAEIVVCCPN